MGEHGSNNTGGNSMTRYRKKPVEVEAMQLVGLVGPNHIVNFCGAGNVEFERGPGGKLVTLIKTLEGTMRADEGDWLIRGVKGEVYPCKPDQPLRWSKPRMIFVCAHGDLFHPNVPDEWIDQVIAVMALAPQHTFQLLTKRADRMRQYFADMEDRCTAIQETDITRAAEYRVVCDDDPNGSRAWHDETARLEQGTDAIARMWDSVPLPNVWLGVSAEDQQRADERIPQLLQTPAAVRWVSAEPQLGPIDLRHSQETESGYSDYLIGGRYTHTGSLGSEFIGGLGKVDWVVAGGESGPGSRPAHPDWFRSLRDQCVAAGVPFFFKQWGDWGPRDDVADPDCTKWETRRITRAGNDGRDLSHADDGGDYYMQRIGKQRTGNLLDGRTWMQYPDTQDSGESE